MTVLFSRYDTAGYLTDEARIAAYLEAVAEEADPALTTTALSAVARARNAAAAPPAEG